MAARCQGQVVVVRLSRSGSVMVHGQGPSGSTVRVHGQGPRSGSTESGSLIDRGQWSVIDPGRVGCGWVSHGVSGPGHGVSGPGHGVSGPIRSVVRVSLSLIAL